MANRLYGRLETLREMKGRFQSDADLPIPFDSCGQMAVDLHCANVRVAIEIDGLQLLECGDAYRRDRHKDPLLQESGYLVRRFLAHGVGKQMDAVLDAIFRALTMRGRS